MEDIWDHPLAPVVFWFGIVPAFTCSMMAVGLRLYLGPMEELPPPT